ncbi:DUF4270 family protein [Hymenobacter sp. BT186]|uniref:DUF4270 family protein n=1 Tax=Hymenobacter telluris TaxID=2816474 RepID=A0A939JA79_9BACT|nr:DUF4270 family protein [Hymenobacter telluris]MBO0359589.1 DUF4270 family protein [Hymenobacter telluris]MBW3375616.1 DUF4270 domain-containing protein [Hymenobacter norwichensis]
MIISSHSPHPRWRFAGGWLVCLLLWALTACEDATSIGAELPPADKVTGTIYVDTLTIRTSTVLVDSVPTSSNSYLLLGRYTDARLGTLTASSYACLGLADGVFQPKTSMVYDSVVLLLLSDSYRYGDTTRTQQVQVHRLRAPIRPSTTYYASSSLAYDAALLGTTTFHARPRPRLDTLRVRLADALGQELLAAGQNRQLGTQDELEARLPGLVLTPGTSDNAALLRFDATNQATTVRLYYHDPAAPATALSYSFSTATGGRHFYQLTAVRNGSALGSLNSYLQTLPSARTAAEAYIQGGLGLQTKIEVPYLLNLNELDGTWVINSAGITLETVTAAENRYFPPPTSLTVYLASRGNQYLGLLADAAGTQITAPYYRGLSARTNLDQGSYSFSLTSYCTAVLKRQIDNYGLILAPPTSYTPEQVVLGGSGNSAHPPKFSLYMTRVL